MEKFFPSLIVFRIYDTVIYHKDHLHPASKFLKLTENDFGGNENKYKFYTNPENWNSILNLQLLTLH